MKITEELLQQLLQELIDGDEDYKQNKQKWLKYFQDADEYDKKQRIRENVQMLEQRNNITGGNNCDYDSTLKLSMIQVNFLGLNNYYSTKSTTTITMNGVSNKLPVYEIVDSFWWKTIEKKGFFTKTLDDSWLLPNGKWFLPGAYKRIFFNKTRWWNRVYDRITFSETKSFMGDIYEELREKLKTKKANYHKRNKRNLVKQKYVDDIFSTKISMFSNVILDFLRFNHRQYLENREQKRVLRMGIPREQWNVVQNLSEFNIEGVAEDYNDDGEDENWFDDEQNSLDDQLYDDNDDDKCYFEENELSDNCDWG